MTASKVGEALDRSRLYVYDQALLSGRQVQTSESVLPKQFLSISDERCCYYVSTGGGKTLVLNKPVIRKDGKFDNPWHILQESFWEIMHWVWLEKRPASTGWLENSPHPTAEEWAAAFPIVEPDFPALHSPPGDAVQAMQIGHATVLVQLGGVTFLTDPMFSDRASPFSFVGPKRVVRPAMRLDDPQLPHIDFVVISHNHYDHLDLPSVKQLHKRFGDSLIWYVPLRLGKWFLGCGIPKANVVELDWWQEVQYKDTKVTVALTPAQHWSNRGVDRMQTLWGGYAVFTSKLRFYFAGDTGYCPVFSQIGEKYGPFDLAAIPIGAYEPRRLMGSQHVDPKEAVKIHQEVRSMRSIGIHCCTFALTDEALDEPPKLLITAARSAGLKEDEFVTLHHGGLIATSNGKDQIKPPTLGKPIS